jgi:hypothetical protein
MKTPAKIVLVAVSALVAVILYRKRSLTAEEARGSVLGQLRYDEDLITALFKPKQSLAEARSVYLEKNPEMVYHTAEIFVAKVELKSLEWDSSGRGYAAKAEADIYPTAFLKSLSRLSPVPEKVNVRISAHFYELGSGVGNYLFLGTIMGLFDRPAVTGNLNDVIVIDGRETSIQKELGRR